MISGFGDSFQDFIRVVADFSSNFYCDHLTGARNLESSAGEIKIQFSTTW